MFSCAAALLISKRSSSPDCKWSLSAEFISSISSARESVGLLLVTVPLNFFEDAGLSLPPSFLAPPAREAAAAFR